MQLLIILSLLLSGCATIVKSDRKTTNFVGPQGTEAKLQTPDGNFVVNGNASYMISRSKADIPIQVTCNNQTQSVLMPTSFDMLWGGAGNLIFGGIPGWIIDGVGDKAYDPPTHFNLTPYCSSQTVPNKMPASVD